MDRILEISFQMISVVGTAKSCFVEAIEAAKEGNQEEAKRLLLEGKNIFKEGHSIHADLIQKEAAGEHVEFNMIFMHAEDQLMSTELIQFMAEELIGLYEERRMADAV